MDMLYLLFLYWRVFSVFVVWRQKQLIAHMISHMSNTFGRSQLICIRHSHFPFPKLFAIFSTILNVHQKY